MVLFITLLGKVLTQEINEDGSPILWAPGATHLIKQLIVCFPRTNAVKMFTPAYSNQTEPKKINFLCLFSRKAEKKAAEDCV